MASEAGIRLTVPIEGLATKPKTQPPRKSHGRALGRVGWGVADQAVSSLTNVAVSFYLVHTLAAAAFGAFSLAYVTYGFALNASRGLSTDPLMVRFSGAEVGRWRRAVAGATGTAIVVGLVAGLISIAAAFAIGGVTGTAFLALGLTLPALMLQDSWRYSFFALGRGSQAFLNDSIWAVAMLPAIAGLRLTGHADVFWVLFAWGASAGVGALAGPLQARVIPRPLRAWQWVYRHRDLGPRYLAEGTISNSGYQFRSYGTGLILGLAALGSLQACVTLFGPTTILFAAMGLVTIPEAARVLQRAPSLLGIFAVAVSLGLAALGLAWGLVVLVALPRGLGDMVLGPIWRPTYPLVLPTVISIVATAVSTGPGAVLHALGASRKSLRVTIFGTTCFIGFSLAGAAIGGAAAGAAGVCWGTAVSSWIVAVVCWWQMRAAMREADIPQSLGLMRLVRKLTRRLGLAAQSPVRTATAAATSASAFTAVHPAHPAGHRRRTPADPATVWRRPVRSAPPRHTRRHQPSTAATFARAALAAAGGIAVIVIAATVGLALAHAPAAYEPARAAQPAASRSSTPPVTGTTALLRPVSLRVVDPNAQASGDIKEPQLNRGHNLAAPWRSDKYASADFKGLKPGVGLLLDMGRAVTITDVQLTLGETPGANVEIRVGNSADSVAKVRSAADADNVHGVATLRSARPAHGQYVLIWFTKLPPESSGNFQVIVYNISVKGLNATP